jgi:hypothetical protein
MKLKGIAKTREVYLDGEYLDSQESQKVYNHSPDGFNWGYGGSGCAQLALAIMLKIFPKEKALNVYQNFKWNVIANLEQGRDFEIEINPKDYDY